MPLGRRNRRGQLANNVPVNNRPVFNAADIKEQLERYDRAPFIELLTKMIQLFPDDTSLAALALKKPELYINSMISMARISGFTEKQEVNVNHTVSVHKMSDSQLEDHAKSLAEQLGFGKLIDISPGDEIATEDARSALGEQP